MEVYKADEAALFQEQSYISFLSALWQFPSHHAHCGQSFRSTQRIGGWNMNCLLYTSDADDERSSVDLGGSRIIKKKKNTHDTNQQRIAND